jgi:tRNA threonylcarbamoyladenosine biosynthesis protein TsaE
VTALPRVAETAGAAETEALAGRLGAALAPGDLVLVSGELGTGKTTFVRGACRALGVEGPVASPTFTIGSRHRGRVPVSHLDLYRLVPGADEDPALLADYLGPDAVTFVEWPDRAPWALGEPALTVELEHLGGDRRRISVTKPEARAQ